MGRRRCLEGISILVAALSVVASRNAAAEPAPFRDTQPDTWVATDGLGRTVPGHEQVGPPRPGKFVGAFYFLWMGQHGTGGPYDITKILAAHPGAMTQPTHPAWGPPASFHFWGEPLFGYYLSDDRWVIRKHAQMLADAGVDVIIFDVTNQETYAKVYHALCETFMRARQDGCRTPQIAFLCPFWNPTKVVARLYEDLYGPGRYRELWFEWKGKPLIMADPDKVAPELRDFFTFRKPQPDYFQGPTGPDQWGWLEKYPQHVFRNAAGEAEQMTVGVAQNTEGTRCCAFSEKNTLGRSWHNGAKDERPDAVNYGLNFAEQWERALAVDPQFIFITGWNEWIAMRLPEFAGVREPVMFVDQYTQEYSRDIEPMKGGHFDHYYYQMVSNIRRFKGVRPRPKASGLTRIEIDGTFDDWRNVKPEYRDDRDDTMHRDHPGYDGAGRYVNRTGRNDFELLKVAADDRSVFFYAQTVQPISPSNDRDWMLLLIDADCDAKTGWAGYDYLVNHQMKDASTSIVQAWRGDRWKNVGEATYRVRGHGMELAIPRAILGFADPAVRPRFDFKWADNLQSPLQSAEDVATFMLNGDVAPNSRFNYRFE